MRGDLDGKPLSRQQPLVTARRARRRRGDEVGEGAVGASEVPGRRVEDGVLFGKSRRQAPGLGEGTLVLLGGLEDRAGKGGGSSSLLGSERLGFRISKAVGQKTRLAKR